ncbi:MAG: YbaB/EbfC family nucleoid-associated protein [Steroidobacteraceae bacterium]
MRGNIGNLMKQAQAMQENLAKAQAQVGQLTAVGESGGGMVKVTMNGKHEVARVQLEPALLSEDREVLEDLIAAAINDATHKVGVVVNEKMSGAMAGLQLPPGMKLPF